MYDSHHQWYKWDESTYKNVRIAGKHTLIKTGSNGFGLMVAAIFFELPSSKNESLLPFTADSEHENFSWSIRIIHNEGRDLRKWLDKVARPRPNRTDLIGL